MKATEITRFDNGAVKFAFEGEEYTMSHRGVISWATPGGWARVATDSTAFPTVGTEFNRGTVYADMDQTFAGEIVPAEAVVVEEPAEVVEASADVERVASVPVKRRTARTVRAVPAFVPAPVTHRETTITIAGVERVIRTEMGGRVRTAKQMEAAHTKAVKAAIVDMRRANLTNLRRKATDLKAARWYPLRDLDVKEVENSIRRAERGTFPTHGTPGVSVAPFPKVKFTETVPEYLVEVEPGHYATAEAAESLALF